jgi:diamine N-acetyltransferase
MAITIELTTNAKLLAALNEQVQSLHHQWYPERFKEWNREGAVSFFRETLSKPNISAFVAKENDDILGYVLLFEMINPENPFQFEHRFLLIDQILVLEKARNKGVGGLLMNTAFDFAKEKNLQNIELNHWMLNETAASFFKKFGFEVKRVGLSKTLRYLPFR